MEIAGFGQVGRQWLVGPVQLEAEDWLPRLDMVAREAGHRPRRRQSPAARHCLPEHGSPAELLLRFGSSSCAGRTRRSSYFSSSSHLAEAWLRKRIIFRVIVTTLCGALRPKIEEGGYNEQINPIQQCSLGGGLFDKWNWGALDQAVGYSAPDEGSDRKRERAPRSELLGDRQRLFIITIPMPAKEGTAASC